MNLTRRSIIKATLATAVCSALPSFAQASLAPARQLYLYNTHTGEQVKTVYWEKGNYISDALAEISSVLRDHRTGEAMVMNNSLLDVICYLHNRMDSPKAFEVISGYRSPQSNAMLHEHSHGVASKSLHMEGKAIDIRLPGRDTRALRDTAWNMQRGGVGYYAASDFVHVDVGRVRSW